MSRSQANRGHDHEILRLAIPAFGSLIAEPLYLLCDSAILGHLGTAELAGLGVAAAILTPAYSVFNFLAYSTTAAVARSRGAGDNITATQQGIAGLWLAIAIGILIVVAGAITAVPLTTAIAPSPRVAHIALQYLHISLVGAPFAMLAFAATGFLRGTEDTKTPLFIALFSNIANLGLEVLFIYGFHWGVAGSAWGTVIAQVLAGAIFVAIVARHAAAARASKRPAWNLIQTSAKVGAHLMLRTASLLGAFLVAAVLAARIGDEQIAAHQVAEQLWILLAFALDSIAIAGQVIVGRTLGEGNEISTRMAANRMLQWGFFSGLLCAAIVLALQGWLPSWFSNDAAVRAQINSLLWIVAAMQPIGALVYVLDGILIGAGDARFLARAMAGAAGVFFVIAAVVTASDGSLQWLWIALFAFVTARFVGLWLRFRGRAWMVLGPTPASATILGAERRQN